jgi:hypothetical protein
MGASKPADAAAVERELAALADPERAAWTAPYLGIVPGGYGEGDALLGIPVPAQRRVARAARDLPLDDVATLLASPVHEHRFTALVVLVERYRRSRDPIARAELSRFYLDQRAGVDNWDLVDATAPDLLGGELIDGHREILGELVASERLWDRRIAIVATFALIAGASSARPSRSPTGSWTIPTTSSTRRPDGCSARPASATRRRWSGSSSGTARGCRGRCSATPSSG